MILKKWDKKSNLVIIVGIFVLSICSVCLFVCSPNGFCQSDEPFYIALTHRMWLGDGLIVDEWHPTQFYSVLLLPFYALYRFAGFKQLGVLLYFRYVYLSIAVITAFRSFLTLQKRYSWFSIFSSLIVLLYSRGNICGPSYYNLSLLFLNYSWRYRNAPIHSTI